ncbi:MAG: HAD family phosphatase [Deltaproteobacteria bacterium]|nr:HAD family phosphatase [Deltaproteobacteria bacterium]
MFRVALFDFDGVIVDTEPIHMEAWLDVLEPLGISFDEATYNAQYLGLNDRDFLDAVLHQAGLQFQAQQKTDLINTKLAVSLSLLQHNIPILPGVLDFITKIQPTTKMGIVSGASRSEIDFVLRELELKEYFNPIISAENVKSGKPDPEGYTTAFQTMKELHPWNPVLTRDDCLVIEDSPKGIAAAKAAGMRCLATTNSYEKKDLHQADALCTTLAEIEPFPIFR